MKLFFVGSIRAQDRQVCHELFEVDIAILVLVEKIKHSVNEEGIAETKRSLEFSEQQNSVIHFP